MSQIKRADRICAITSLLISSPNKVHSFAEFCDMFGTAKSTISEDIEIIATNVERFGLGEVRTIAGASGGVRYRAKPSREKVDEFIRRISMELSDESRVLPGGFLYTNDIACDSYAVHMAGDIIASMYYDQEPDVVLTMETKGIPIASATAFAMNVPLVTARRDSRAYEGTAFKINYVSGNGGDVETMALPRRAMRPGQKVLIVDDFAKGGGTLIGMRDMAEEFDARVIGTCVFIVKDKLPISGLDVKSIIKYKGLSDDGSRAVITEGNFR